MTTEDYESSGQIVEAENFRFTVLTDRLIRIEYAEDAIFEDRPTLAVPRHPPTPTNITVHHDGRTTTIDTGSFVLTCTDTTREPTASTLSAARDVGEPIWRFGGQSDGNLGGTVRTLDMWNGDSLQRITGHDPATGFTREWDPQPLGDGFLSRSGWSVLDDSGTVVLHGGWPVRRSDRHLVDQYLFVYGLDHKAALGAANGLIGPVPLPPRWVFGYWYSRYFPYTDTDLLSLVDELDAHGIPVDVLVIDMDWHRPGWTGYSWDHDLFQDPSATLAELHRRGLHTTLNLHPADGIGRHEDAFEAMCGALGLDPATTAHIPFDPTDPAFVDAYFRILHHPEEDRGVDFWWLDWQQGTESAMDGLDPLAWLNQIHWDDQDRHPDRRPLNFSRWDGVGAARRPIGFSGDTYVTWESLAFQPYFTATAANVLFGYWSHDIGGHFGGSGNPELFLRWIQFGTHSPILRTHGSVDMVEERRIWEYPNPHRRAMIDAIHRRYELIPYIYTSCAIGGPRGRSLVSPMYHEHPDNPVAYDAPGQYYFGPEMIVSPVATPVAADGLASMKTWLPHGSWYDAVRGAQIDIDQVDGTWIERNYLIDEVPVFIRGGAIIPTQSETHRSVVPFYENLVFETHPGGSSTSLLYEDDGTTKAYIEGEFVTVGMTHVGTIGDRTFELTGHEGGYPSWNPVRPVVVEFIGEPPPEVVEMDEGDVPWSATRRRGHWSYDSSRAAVVVDLGEVDLRSPLRVTVRSKPDKDPAGQVRLPGLPGLLHRLSSIDHDIRVLLNDSSRVMARLGRTSERIDAAPSNLGTELVAMSSLLDELRAGIDSAIEFWSVGESLEPLKEPRATTALRRANEQLTTAVNESLLS